MKEQWETGQWEEREPGVQQPSREPQRYQIFIITLTFRLTSTKCVKKGIEPHNELCDILMTVKALIIRKCDIFNNLAQYSFNNFNLLVALIYPNRGIVDLCKRINHDSIFSLKADGEMCALLVFRVVQVLDDPD